MPCEFAPLCRRKSPMEHDAPQLKFPGRLRPSCCHLIVLDGVLDGVDRRPSSPCRLRVQGRARRAAPEPRFAPPGFRHARAQRGRGDCRRCPSGVRGAQGDPMPVRMHHDRGRIFRGGFLHGAWPMPLFGTQPTVHAGRMYEDEISRIALPNSTWCATSFAWPPSSSSPNRILLQRNPAASG